MKRMTLLAVLIAAALSGCSEHSTPASVLVWDVNGCAYTAIWQVTGDGGYDTGKEAYLESTSPATRSDPYDGVELQRFPVDDKDTCKIKPKPAPYNSSW